MPVVPVTIADRAASLLQRFEVASHAAATDAAGVRFGTPDPAANAELLAVNEAAHALAADVRTGVSGGGVERIRSVGAWDIGQVGRQLDSVNRMADWAHTGGYQLWTGLAQLHAGAAAGTAAQRIDQVAAHAHRALGQAISTLEGATPPGLLTAGYEKRYALQRGTAYRAIEAADLAHAVVDLADGVVAPSSVADAQAAASQVGAASVWQAHRFGPHTAKAAVARQLGVLHELDAHLAAAFASARASA